MSTCADVGSVIESKKSVVQTSNVGFTSEVSDYLVVHTGPELSLSPLPLSATSMFMYSGGGGGGEGGGGGLCAAAAGID